MKSIILRHSLVALTITLLGVGCASTTVERDTGSSGQPSITMAPETEDFAIAAEGMVKSLLAKGVFDKVPNPPAKLRVITLLNNTAEHFDVDLLTMKMREALTESGSTAIVLNPALPVDFIMSGKIISQYARSGDVRRRTYTFQLTLTDPSGTVTWAKEVIVTKTKRS